MAKVYLGRVHGEGGFEREMAVKVMHDHLRDDPDFVKMFLDEARLAARLRHPNVVPTLDVQKTPQALYLVMEFIEGLTLSALLRQVCEKVYRSLVDQSELEWDDARGEIRQQPVQPYPLPLGIALRIGLDLLHGLHGAHELRDRHEQPLHIVHRDVSPSNVLVGTDGVSRITDFGVARAEARLASTQGRALKGKVPYLAPEQIDEDTVDRRTDVYAAGTVIWEMLTGRRLFAGEHEGAVLKQVVDGATTPPSALNHKVPPYVDNVIMRAVAREPDRRFATAAAFADALEEAARYAEVSIADQRKVARFVSDFETNAAKIRMTESMLNMRQDAGVNAAIEHAAMLAEQAEPNSQPSVGSTKTAAILDPSEIELLTPRRGRRLAGWLIGIGAVAVGFTAAYLLLGSSSSSDAASTGAGAPSDGATTSLVAAGGAPGAQAATAKPTAAAPSISVADADAAAPEASAPEPSPGGRKWVGSGKKGPRETSTALPSEFLPPEL